MTEAVQQTLRTSGAPTASRRNPRQARNDIVITILLVITLFLVFIPVILMMFMSLRNTGQILTRFWDIPRPVILSNYPTAWEAVKGYMFNSVIYCSLAVIMVVALSSLSGYALATIEFPGKEALYMAILALMMIPGVLTLFPRINIVYGLGIVNTMWALVLPWSAGGQVLGIMLMRTAFEGIHPEIREAAHVDGATDIQIFYRVCLPLAWPMAMTLAIMHFVGTYNDFVWPLIIIQEKTKQVMAVGVREFAPTYGSRDLGAQMAAFVLSSLPLLVVFLFGMRYYIAGIASGAVKM